MKEGKRMDKLDHRISYIEGLADGMELFQDKEGKFYQELIYVISDLNSSIQNIGVRLTELEEYVEAIDEDLNDLEWDYYEDDEQFDEDIDYYEMEDDDLLDEEDLYDELVAEDGVYHLLCPVCHETVIVEQDLFESNNVEQIICPHCQEVLIIEDDEPINTPM